MSSLWEGAIKRNTIIASIRVTRQERIRKKKENRRSEASKLNLLKTDFFHTKNAHSLKEKESKQESFSVLGSEKFTTITKLPQEITYRVRPKAPEI